MYFGFKDITVGYADKTVINNISMEFRQGEIATIVGRNGCGKSTLLKTVTRSVKPYAGEVVFKDRVLGDYKPKELARCIAYLPQIHKSPSDMTVRGLVENGRFPYRTLTSDLSVEDNDAIDRALEFTGLVDIQSRRLLTLSGGERQRAWIAMTIAVEPEVLVLDEPTTYLDIAYQLEVMELIHRLKLKRNVTVVLVLHDINLAARFSDRVYAIKDGGLFAEGTPFEIFDKKNIKNIFGIDAQVYTDEKNNCPYILPDRLF